MRRLLGVFVTLILAASLVPQSCAALWINELMASNQSTITDPGGGYADWFEIYNDAATPVDLGNKFVSDDPLDTRKSIFLPGLMVPAHGFLLLWADSDPIEGPDHVAFHLDALIGEEISLYESDAAGHGLIDTISYGPQSSDISFGRQTDGSAAWIFFTTSTPGASNNGGEPCDTILCGDCNQDGSINILDALKAAQHSAGVVTLVGAAFDNCNVNRDTGSTTVDILDALALARFDLGLGGPLSCCP